MERSTKEQRQGEKSNGTAREKEPLAWLLSVRAQPGLWCDTHLHSPWERLPGSLYRQKLLPERGWESLGDAGGEHLWDCTRQLLGCLEEEPKVGVRGDKDSLI